MLLYADIQHVAKIADQYDCQCNRHSKQEMIQSLLYKILQKKTITSLIEQIDDTEYSFVMLLYLDQKDQYTMEDLLAKGKKVTQLHQSSEKPRELILKSLRKGWIFQGVGKHKTLVYLIPQDLKKVILELFRTQLLAQIENRSTLSFYRDEKNLIAADCQTFLKFVSKEEVLLTGDGNIYKRQQQLLFNQFLVVEEPLKKQGFRFGYGRRYHEYPDRFSLIYDYAYFKKLIDEDQVGILKITSVGLNQLEQGNIEQITRDMYQFWTRLYKTSIPHLPLIVRLIDLLANEKWVAIHELEGIMLFWLKDHYYETKKIIFNDRIVKMLHHLGIIQIGQDEEKSYIRLTKEGHQYIHGIEIFQAKEIELK